MKLLIEYQVKKESADMQLASLVTLNKHKLMGCVKGDYIVQVGGPRNAAGEERGKHARSGRK